MAVEVARLDPDETERWNGLVERSAQANPFHAYDVLAVQAEFSDSELHPLVGYAGGEPIGIFPLFSLRRGPVTAAFSPPPNLWIPRLGPAFLPGDSSGGRRAERRRLEFVDAALEWLADAVGPRYVRVRTVTRLADVRPFVWSGCDVTPEYTYVVDLTVGEDGLLERFSSDARQNVRAGANAETSFRIEVGDRDDVAAIMRQVRRRYRKQDEPFGVPEGFLPALYDRVPGDWIRPYVLSVEGRFVGGIVAVDDGERVVGWHGGVTPDADVDLPVNDLLDWRIMADGIERGRRRYEIVGAGDPRLNRYKAKFAPALRTFYTVERSSLATDLLLGGARRLRRVV